MTMRCVGFLKRLGKATALAGLILVSGPLLWLVIFVALNPSVVTGPPAGVVPDPFQWDRYTVGVPGAVFLAGLPAY
jgi:hypothetical protein